MKKSPRWHHRHRHRFRDPQQLYHNSIDNNQPHSSLWSEMSTILEDITLRSMTFRLKIFQNDTYNSRDSCTSKVVQKISVSKQFGESRSLLSKWRLQLALLPILPSFSFTISVSKGSQFFEWSICLKVAPRRLMLTEEQKKRYNQRQWEKRAAENRQESKGKRLRASKEKTWTTARESSTSNETLSLETQARTRGNDGD